MPLWGSEEGPKVGTSGSYTTAPWRALTSGRTAPGPCPQRQSITTWEQAHGLGRSQPACPSWPGNVGRRGLLAPQVLSWLWPPRKGTAVWLTKLALRLGTCPDTSASDIASLCHTGPRSLACSASPSCCCVGREKALREAAAPRGSLGTQAVGYTARRPKLFPGGQE